MRSRKKKLDLKTYNSNFGSNRISRFVKGPRIRCSVVATMFRRRDGSTSVVDVRKCAVAFVRVQFPNWAMGNLDDSSRSGERRAVSVSVIRSYVSAHLLRDRTRARGTNRYRVRKIHGFWTKKQNKNPSGRGDFYGFRTIDPVSMYLSRIANGVSILSRF